MKRQYLLCSVMLLIALTAVEAAAQVETKPLHSFISSKGYRLYKIGPGVPAGLSDGPWKDEGVVGHVMSKQVSGTKPVYQLVKADGYGVRFAYTSDAAEANKYNGGSPDPSGLGQWSNQGPQYFVATMEAPGTVPLFRLYLPVKFETVTSSLMGVINNTKRMMLPGTDSQFCTTSRSERTHATNNGWVEQPMLGYVWKEPFPPPAPDLIIENSTAEDSRVRAIVANKGKSNTGGQPVNVALYVYERSGKQIFVTAKDAGGLSAGQLREVVIPTGNVGLRNRRYKLMVDSNYMISESNEKNNETAMFNGPMGLKVVPLPPNHVYPPSITLVDVQPAPGGRVNYRLAVTNWKQFKPESFQSLENILPPGPCGGADTNARLIARLVVLKEGLQTPTSAGCKPLNSPQDLQRLDLKVATKLGDHDRLSVTVSDRGTGEKYEAPPYTIGWFGLGKVLGTVGCEKFLNRAGHYVCSTDQGMTACDNMRKNGKPIQCTRTGKNAK